MDFVGSRNDIPGPDTEGFTDAKVQALRDILSGGKKPKAADVIRVLAEPAKEELP
jgi:hypothetical protein